jgi:hypothetical protein
MKEAKNNEIDLMLRSLARRGQSTSAGHSLEDEPGVRQGQLHLDADELNSYAENALPAAARARYTEHLADCSTCRKIAAQLSLASGATLRPFSAEARKPWSLSGFLAAVLSAPVLRYAVPALSLIAIVAVALMINRQQSTPKELVARNEPSATSSLQENQQPKLSDAGAATSEKNATASDRVRSDSGPTKTAATLDREQAKAEDKPRVDDSKIAQERVRKEPVRETKSSDVAARPASAPSVAAEPAPPKEQAANDVSETRDFAKQKSQPVVAGQAGGTKKEAEEPQSVDKVSASRAAPKRTESLPMAGRSVQGIASTDSGRRSGSGKSDKDEAETRSVAGHRFRKEGGVWVDAAYDSSRPTVTLTRGSEQYRALVADEPAIHTIAEQLDGQIIIAWKGRTYKIR